MEGESQVGGARPPLVRAVLLRLDPQHPFFAICLHHTVCDGAPLRVLFRELEALYRAERDGRPPQLPPLPADCAEQVGRVVGILGGCLRSARGG